MSKKLVPDDPRVGQTFYAYQYDSGNVRAGQLGFCCSTQCHLEVSLKKALAEGEEMKFESDEDEDCDIIIWEMKRVL